MKEILTNDVSTDGMRLSMSCKHKLQKLICMTVQCIKDRPIYMFLNTYLS